MHGGAAPQVKAKASQRLLAAADSVAGELVRLALNADSEAVRVQAARDILDRAGLSARQLVSTEVTHHNGDSELDAEIRQLMARLVGGGPAQAEPDE